MTRKERILKMLDRMPDDVPYDTVLDRLDTMRDIEIAMEQVKRGEFIEDDELFAELEAENAKDTSQMVAARQGQSPKYSTKNRRQRHANGSKVRRGVAKDRQSAKKTA